MAVLVTCKFNEDQIKTECAINRTTFSSNVYVIFFRHSRACNSKANIPIWPKFELRRDFMPVLVTCKFDEVPIKIEGSIDRTRSNIGFFGRSELSDLAGIRIYPRFYGCPGYMPIWRRSDQKWSRYYPENIFSIISLWEKISSLKGK